MEGFEQQILNPLTLGNPYCQGVFGIIFAKFPDAILHHYDDAFDISEYAIPAMQYVIGAGIINGKTIGTVNPEDNATRAEIAVILHRFIEKNKKI